MVLETVLADVFHQALQVVHLRYGDAAVHAVGVVGYLTLAQIGLDAALRVVGGKTEEGEGTFRHLGVDGAESVHLAQRAAQNAEGTQFQVVVADKRLGEVAAVGAHTFVAVLGKVVVPVQKGRGLTGGQSKGIHRHGTGKVGLAGGGNQLVAQHRHRHTGGAAVVLLQRVPALDGHGLHIVGGYPGIDGHTELGLQTQLLAVVLRHLGIMGDVLAFL